jgi:putative SOS response-associated peptidase YedK
MTAEQKALFEKFSYLEQDEYFDIHGYKKRPEIFPGEEILAVNNQHKAENIWWTIEDRDQSGTWRRTINAKAENVLFADMFKNAFLSDRVLIPADGLFEWHQLSNKAKKKYEIWFDEPVFAFGGLARDCEIKGDIRRCGVIITTKPNDIFAKIHNAKQRQAVVIHSYDYEKWLDPDTPVTELKRLMQPVDNEETHYRLIEDQTQPGLFGADDEIECEPGLESDM